jgi:hypothetical protein
VVQLISELFPLVLMKSSSRFLTMACLTAASITLLATGATHAQTAATEAAISKIEAQLVTAPAVTYSGAPAKMAPSKKWLEVEATFAWQPPNPNEKYTDDLVVNYYVLLNNKSPLYPQGALLTGQTALSSVPARSLDSKNGELKTVIYASPRVMERMFGGKAPMDNSAIVDVGVTISKQGQIVAQKSLKSSSGSWWPQYQQVPGFLLNKSETPFAPLNWDYYEAAKKQQ